MLRTTFVLVFVLAALMPSASFAVPAATAGAPDSAAVAERYVAAAPERYVADAAPAPSSLDAALEHRERERRSQAAAMEAVTLFVQATGKEGVIRGSGLALEDGRILTLASVVGEDEEAVLLAAGEGLSPTPVEREAREERNGKRAGSDFVLLRFTSSPSFVIPMPVVFDDARPGDRVTAWGCVGIPLEMTEDKPEGTAHVYIPPPPLGSGGQVLSAEPGELLRHSALPAAQAAGGPLAGEGKSVVGLNIGVPEADDGDGLAAPARPASEIAAFLRACRGEPALPSPEAGSVLRPSTIDEGSASAPTSADAANERGPLPAPVKAEEPGGTGSPADKVRGSGSPAPASAGAEDISAPAPAADAESGRVPAPAKTEETDGPASIATKTERPDGTGSASGRFESNGATTAQVASLLCSARREDREKGAALLRALVSRRDAEPESLALFAWALRAGLYPDADEHEAPAAAEKAAKAGNSLGKAVLGLLYGDALLLPADPRRARALAEEAAAEGENLGVSLQALFAYEDGSPEALREALRGAEKAAAAGDAAAMGLAACLYALHAEFTDYRTAEKRARTAAGYGDSLGLYILARLYNDGTVTERDPVKAWACARLALDRESGPHREERKALFEELDGRLNDQEKEHGRRILRALLLNRLPG